MRYLGRFRYPSQRTLVTHTIAFGAGQGRSRHIGFDEARCHGTNKDIERRQALGQQFVDNFHHWRRGQPLDNPVSKEHGYVTNR